MHRQSGYALVELAIAAALASLIAIWTASLTSGRLDDAVSEAAGRWLLGLRSALEQMLVREHDSLSGLEPPSGRYADPHAPTVAELKAAGHLAEGFPEVSPLGLPAGMRVLRSGACPGPACRLQALAMMQTVVPGDPGPDPVRVGQLLLSTGGYGGSVRQDDPSRLRGALFDLPNPVAPGAPVLPAGSVAVYASLDLTLFERFVRMRDNRDPSLRGELSVDGAMQAGGAIVTQGGVQARQDLVTQAGVRAQGNVVSQGSVRAEGAISAGGTLRAEGNIAGDAAISAAGRLSTGEFLHLRTAVAEGSRCAAAGLVARDPGGALLSCQGGAWRSHGGSAWFSQAYSLQAGTAALVQTYDLASDARFCAVAHHLFSVSSLIHDNYNFAHACSVRHSAGRWQLTVRADTGRTQCQAVCLR